MPGGDTHTAAVCDTHSVCVHSVAPILIDMPRGEDEEEEEEGKEGVEGEADSWAEVSDRGGGDGGGVVSARSLMARLLLGRLVL